MNLLPLLVLGGLVSAAELLWSADLETDDGGLVSYGQTDQWEWGTVTSGPEASYDGTACWATQTGGRYLNDSVDHLELASLDLSVAARPVLAFQHWYSFQAGDLATLEVERSGVWEPVEPVYGYPAGSAYAGSSGSWQPAWVDLTGLVDGDRLRFTITTDGAGADQGWYVDQLELWDGDPVPPLLQLEGCLGDTEDQDGPYPLAVTALDDLSVFSVVIGYSVDGQPVRRHAMSRVSGDRWEGNIPGQVFGSEISYTIEASDGENTSFAPDEPCSFEVRLPAPSQLQGPTGVFWGTEAPLSWTPPQTAFSVLGYRVYRDEALVLEVEQALAEVAVTSGEQSFAVSAVYEAGEGTLSEPVTVRAAVPTLSLLEPEAGYQGDQLRLRLQGEYLLLQQDDLEIDLGEGVRVNDYDVRDVDLAYVTIFVAANAPAGLRDLELYTGGQRLFVPQAFEVLSGSERPRLLGVVPNAVRQGDELALEILASDPFADLPTIWLGEHILVEAVELSGEDTLTVEIVVPYDTPLGLHDLEVDDGTRIYTGFSLQVRDYIAPVTPDRTCGVVPGRGGLLGTLISLLAVVGLRRRVRYCAGALRQPELTHP